MQILRRVTSRRPRVSRSGTPRGSTISLTSAGSGVSSASGSDDIGINSSVDGEVDWSAQSKRPKSAPSPSQYKADTPSSPVSPPVGSHCANSHVNSEADSELEMFVDGPETVVLRNEGVQKLKLGCVLVGSELVQYAQGTWSGAEVALVDQEGVLLGHGQALMPGELICGGSGSSAVDPCMASSPCVLVTLLNPR